MVTGSLLYSYLLLKRNYLYGPKVFHRELSFVSLLEDSGDLAKLNDFYIMMILSGRRTGWGNYLHFHIYFFL